MVEPDALNQPMDVYDLQLEPGAVRQTRSAISSVLKESTKLSASALSKASADRPDRGEHAVVIEHLAQSIEHEVGAHVAGELRADEPARPDVDDEGKEDHAFPQCT